MSNDDDTTAAVRGLMDHATGREIGPDELVELVERELDAQGLNAADLARASGFSQGHISQIRNRVKYPTLGTALVLANAVGMLDLHAGAAHLKGAGHQGSGFAPGAVPPLEIAPPAKAKPVRKGKAS